MKLFPSGRSVAALVLAFLLPCAMAYAEYDAGRRAFEAGDFATAWRELLQAQSNPRSLVALGYMAETGQGTKQDFVVARHFYEMAVRERMTQAMVALGLMYDHGRGVQRNGGEAQRLYAMAATAIATSNDNNVAADQMNRTAKLMLTFLWARQGGLLNEALCLSSQLLSAEPNNPAYLDAHGLVLLRMNRLEAAERSLNRALAQQAAPVVLEHMGDLAHARNDMTAAHEWWKKALNLTNEPNHVARLTRKIAGRADDFDSHPPFVLDSSGLGRDCVSS